MLRNQLDQLKKSYTLNFDAAQYASKYGDGTSLRVFCKVEDHTVLDEIGSALKVGIRLFENGEKVREYRLQRDENDGDRISFVGQFNHEYLKPGPYDMTADFVIDHVGWVESNVANANLVIEKSAKFMDVKELLKKYSVEELCATAEEFYQTHIDNPWMRQKTYSLKDIQHNYPQIAFLIRGLDLKQDHSIIDFGAGTGWVSRTLYHLGLDVTSMDVSKTALEISEKIFQDDLVLPNDGKMSFQFFDGHKMTMSDNSIDRFLCNDALHHVPNREDVLAEVFRVLKPGSKAGFCEPGANHSLIGRSQQEMLNYKVVENDMPLDELRDELLSVGFQDISIMVHNALPQAVPVNDWLDLNTRQAVLSRYVKESVHRSEIVQIFFATKPG